ncbi:hypothetical protein V6N13_024018 [Hibiscus sabdariffa]|uniref:Helicase ATP-binding domain-containing protein n=1 Tax=Hibiscus sabdariffa TaxID=183260 RepID=A0ABR2A989_9ROSI
MGLVAGEVPFSCALGGQSLLFSADTGSGKTASFLIPIISLFAKFRQDNFSNLRKPLAMVLTPTRELGIPVEDQAMMIGKGLPFKTALVVGGDPIARQLYRVPQGVELVIGATRQAY